MTQSFERPDRKPDFQDCFSGPNAHPDLSARELAEMAVTRSPAWFRSVFKIRQSLARLAGLKTKSEDGSEVDVSFLLSLPEMENSENRYVAGLNDIHLDFSIAVEKEGNCVHLTTKIWFNNLFGRAYLVVVRPFHDKIVSHWVRTLGNAQ